MDFGLEGLIGASVSHSFGHLARVPGEKEIRRAYHKKALLLHPDKLAEKPEQVREPNAPLPARVGLGNWGGVNHTNARAHPLGRSTLLFP